MPINRENVKRKLRPSVIVDDQWPEDAGLTVILLRITLCGEKEWTERIAGPALIPFIVENWPEYFGLSLILVCTVINQRPGRDWP